MKYLAIGLMSGSSLDGLDIVLVEFETENGRWKSRVIAKDCVEYEPKLRERLKNAIELPAKAYLLLHTEFGRLCGEKVMSFLRKNKISDRIDVIGSHGHTTFHIPERRMDHQLGDGAALSAITGIPVVSDLRAMDIALDGEGAPIVPIGEQLLFPDFKFFMNIGGIANVSIHESDRVHAFDICPANRVLNMLSREVGLAYDKGGKMARKGEVDRELLALLDQLDYYDKQPPKSLPNDFGTDVVYPLVHDSGISIVDQMASYCEHIAHQTARSLEPFLNGEGGKILITGGGALNTFLVEKITENVQHLNLKAVVPDEEVVQFKEAIVMALLGVLRLRNEATVLSSVTGADKDSCGGALWDGRVVAHQFL